MSKVEVKKQHTRPKRNLGKIVGIGVIRSVNRPR